MYTTKQHTLAIIKPNTLSNGQEEEIVAQIKKAGFEIKKTLFKHLNIIEARNFYAVHAEQPFYQSLSIYMSSGFIMIMELEKENAIADFRELIGATNPKEAAPHTLRAQFGTSIEHNAIHGSDSKETARTEIDFFFA